MPLSKQYLAGNTRPVPFDPDTLGSILREGFPLVSFACLMGSAVNGVVAIGSDLDLAFYLNGKPDLGFYGRVPDVVAEAVPGVRVDFGILNHAEPVYRFEALKGRLLFVRDREIYLNFFSRTCREYEDQMHHYENQLRYRREAAHAG